MPRVEVRFYCDSDGAAPALRWLEDLADREPRAYLKCREVLGRLAQFGYELRRPTADLLESGVYELRARVGRRNLRLLYFFHGRHAAVLVSGFAKEGVIPPIELSRALERKARYQSDPSRHTLRE